MLDELDFTELLDLALSEELLDFPLLELDDIATFLPLLEISELLNESHEDSSHTDEEESSSFGAELLLSSPQAEKIKEQIKKRQKKYFICISPNLIPFNIQKKRVSSQLQGDFRYFMLPNRSFSMFW